MKKIRQMNRWGIYELNDKEKKIHGFNFAVIHPDTMGTGLIEPCDTDMEMESLEEAESWIEHYND